MTQAEFLRQLEQLIEATRASGPFKGRTKALAGLRRVRDLSDLNK